MAYYHTIVSKINRSSYIGAVLMLDDNRVLKAKLMGHDYRPKQIRKTKMVKELHYGQQSWSIYSAARDLVNSLLYLAKAGDNISGVVTRSVFAEKLILHNITYVSDIDKQNAELYRNLNFER